MESRFQLWLEFDTNCTSSSNVQNRGLIQSGPSFSVQQYNSSRELSFSPLKSLSKAKHSSNNYVKINPILFTQNQKWRLLKNSPKLFQKHQLNKKCTHRKLIISKDSYLFELLYYTQKICERMDPNDSQELVQSPKEEVEYRNFSEAEREAEFRRKRQEFIAEKLARKKQLLKLKREEFGTSSSDQSDEQGGSRSSGSSAIKSQKVKKSEPRVETTPVKLEIPPKNMQLSTPTKKKSQSLERIPINALSKKGNEWIKDVLVIGEKTIIIQNLTQQTKKFSKIKIVTEAVLGSPFKTKITVEDHEVIFSVSVNQEKAGLPLHYYTFAKLVQLRLTQNGIKLRESYQQKIPGVPDSLISGSLIYGKINKKSQVLGNWQERFILINKEGIFSYKKFNQKHSMFIAAGSINQMWTRFEVQENLLIVKIWHSSKKTQFGFPLVDYLNTTNWLYCFYCMMSRGK